MQKIIQISDDFWNIRGSFHIGGLIDIGTHASLARLATGKFVFLDSYAFSGHVARELNRITQNGADVEAVLNLHPFHTVHVEAMHRQFPGAKIYGTARHLSNFPDLPWEALRTEEKALHSRYAGDFAFSVPEGVDFISADDKVHFSSVLAYHRSSKTIHVDDTYMYARLPLPLRLMGVKDVTRFHPTLAKALQPRTGASRDFRQWAKALSADWGAAENLCTAHLATLAKGKNNGLPIAKRLLHALSEVEKTLANHEQKYG